MSFRKQNFAKILQSYGLIHQKIWPTQKGYRNQVIPIELTTGQKVSLIVYKNEVEIVNRIKNANLVSDYLAQQGFPCRQTLKNLSGLSLLRLTQNKLTRYACLYTYLPGQTISWEAYTKKHLKLIGQVLAQLHQQLAYAPKGLFTSLPLASEELKQLNQSMAQYFQQASVQAALKKKLQLKLKPKIFNHFEQLLSKVEKLLHQPLHLDFVRSNLLFSQPELKKSLGKSSQAKNSAAAPVSALQLTGILDFEKTALGDPILDLARTLAFLIVDCKYKTEVQVKKYFLRSGYQKRGAGKLNQAQLSILPWLINWFLFYDFYKFLKHNPYESLPQNEHFARTRQYLVAKKYLIMTSTLAAATNLRQTHRKS